MKISQKLLVVASLLALSGAGYAEADTQTNTNVKNSTSHHRTMKAKKHKHAMKVDINTATVSQIARLKGVGKKKAEAIVAYRKEHGNFKTVHDLSKVHGMTPRIMKLNQNKIVVNEK